MNEIKVTGNVGRDAVIRHTQAGKPICNFSLADSYGKDDKRQTTWWNVTLFDDLALENGNRLKKGTGIELTGRAQVRSYTGRDGLEKQSMEIIAYTLRIDREAKARTAERPRIVAPEKRLEIMAPMSESDLPF